MTIVNSERRKWYAQYGKCTFLSWQTIERLVDKLSRMLLTDCGSDKPIGVYGIARGGNIPATMLAYRHPLFRLVDDLREANIILDDINDSGQTIQQFTSAPSKLVTLVERVDTCCPLVYVGKYVAREHGYIVFPWETLHDIDTKRAKGN